jgi:hypothetical protein
MRVIPTGEVLALLKAVHGQEDREEAVRNTEQVVAKLEGMRSDKEAELVRGGREGDVGLHEFPSRALGTYPHE